MTGRACLFAVALACAALPGCSWFQRLADNPVQAVQTAETDANLAVSVVLAEWQHIKPMLSREDAAKFETKLNQAVVLFQRVEAAALDAAQIAADGKSSNWMQLVIDLANAATDIVRVVEQVQSVVKSSGKIGAAPDPGAVPFALRRIEVVRAKAGR